jgi:hypothetical protein
LGFIFLGGILIIPVSKQESLKVQKYEKGDIITFSIDQVIKYTCCFSRVGGSHRVLRLPPPLKLAEILLKVLIKHQKSNQPITTTDPELQNF